jgi:hypothetical protein
MRNLMAKLWADDDGALMTTEWALLVMVLVIGVAVGFFAVRQVILTKVVDFTNHSQGGAPNQGVTGQADSEVSTEGTHPKYNAEPIVVKSTAAVPGGVDSRSCD